MKAKGYRNLVGLELREEDLEKGAEILLKEGYPFELVQGTIFLVSNKVAGALEKSFHKANITTKRISVVSMNEFPPEERSRIRQENLKDSAPITL